MGQVIPWQLGLTKETDRRIALGTEKSVATKRENYDPNDHWHRSSTDEVLKRIEHSMNDRFRVIDQNLRELVDLRISNAKLKLNIQCMRCELVTTKNVQKLIQDGCRCSNCDRQYSSQFEQDVQQFIASLGFETKTRQFFGQNEIDIVIPDARIAVECNGLYWHSSRIQEDKNYHERKRLVCEKSGYRLIHVFEDEWRHKRNFIEDLLKKRLGKSPQKLDARSLSFSIMDERTRKLYFDSNHIDGDVEAESAIALLSKDSIVSMISLKSIDDRWSEIVRFADVHNMEIAGSFERLLIIARELRMKRCRLWLDTRHGHTVDDFQHAGFSFKRFENPRSWATDGHERYARTNAGFKTCSGGPIVITLSREFEIWGTAPALLESE